MYHVYHGLYRDVLNVLWAVSRCTKCTMGCITMYQMYHELYHDVPCVPQAVAVSGLQWSTCDCEAADAETAGSSAYTSVHLKSAWRVRATVNDLACLPTATVCWRHCRFNVPGSHFCFVSGKCS